MKFSLTKLGGVLLALSLAAKPFIPAKAQPIVALGQSVATAALPEQDRNDAAQLAGVITNLIGAVGVGATIIGGRNAIAKNGAGQ